MNTETVRWVPGCGWAGGSASEVPEDYPLLSTPGCRKSYSRSRSRQIARSIKEVTVGDRDSRVWGAA